MLSRVSMRWMIAALTGGLLAASVALVLSVNLTTAYRQWTRDSLVQAYTIAGLLALTSQRSLQHGDLIAMDQLLKEVTRDPRLERVIVADPRGEPVSASAAGQRVPSLLRAVPTLGGSYRILAEGSHSQVLVPVTRLGRPLGAVFVRKGPTGPRCRG